MKKLVTLAWISGESDKNCALEMKTKDGEETGKCGDCSYHSLVGSTSCPWQLARLRMVKHNRALSNKDAAIAFSAHHTAWRENKTEHEQLTAVWTKLEVLARTAKIRAEYARQMMDIYAELETIEQDRNEVG